MVKLILENRIIKVKSGTKISEIIDLSYRPKVVMGAMVDNIVKTLNYPLTRDCNFEFVFLDSEEGMKIYERTLLLIVTKAFNDIFTGDKLIIEHSFGGGIYMRINNKKITLEEINKLKEKVQEIISSASVIKKHKFEKKRAGELLNKNITIENIDLLEYVKEEIISLYEIDNFYGYFYGKVLPNTNYISAFDIIEYENGAILLAADKNNIDEIAPFRNLPKLFKAFESFNDWADNLKVNDIFSLNKEIEKRKCVDIVLASEARHEYLISKMADEIINSKEKKRIILIAGPSSSGKTTTSKRLKTQLVVRGLNPITIGLDDYFVNRGTTPLDEYGKPDFEAIEAIDIPLFNEHLKDLIKGKEVEIPIFNFKTGFREENGVRVKINNEDIIIIEGIHGLNERLTENIPKSQKYKVYINPLTVINIDNYNRIPTSEIRLIRRIVRDNDKRNKTAVQTLEMWDMVRKGEEKNIFPYQEDADFVFNSALLYEIAVLKKYAIPLLEKTPLDSPFLYKAQSLISLLSYFLEVEDESLIPRTSILREFIGNSIY